MSDLQESLQELEKLLTIAQKQRVKDILSREIRKVQSEIAEQAVKASKKESEAQAKPATEQRVVYTKDITNYAWDQTSGMMKIYITDLKDVQKLPAENITSEFGNRSVKITISNLNGFNYKLHIVNLSGDIVPAKSSHKAKTDMVLIMLKKAEEKNWAYITETDKKSKEKKTPKLDDNKDPSAGLMDLMKQMYEDGDDDMKRTIAKAWTESQDKRNKETL